MSLLLLQFQLQCPPNDWTLTRKGMPSRDGCIQDLERGQHNYVNTPTSHDPERTPADINGRREDYSSYNQLLCPINLPLTSASLYLIPCQHSHYRYVRPTMSVFCHRLLSARNQVEMRNSLLTLYSAAL